MALVSLVLLYYLWTRVRPLHVKRLHVCVSGLVALMITLLLVEIQFFNAYLSTDSQQEIERILVASYVVCALFYAAYFLLDAGLIIK